VGTCEAWHVTAGQAINVGEERRPDAILAFLGAGLFRRLSRAEAVAALAAARRGVATCQARRASVRQWLAGEVHLHGIRENAAVLAVLEIPDLREEAAQSLRPGASRPRASTPVHAHRTHLTLARCPPSPAEALARSEDA
jgi:hypothetical protein